MFYRICMSTCLHQALLDFSHTWPVARLYSSTFNQPFPFSFTFCSSATTTCEAHTGASHSGRPPLFPVTMAGSSHGKGCCQLWGQRRAYGI